VACTRQFQWVLATESTLTASNQVDVYLHEDNDATADTSDTGNVSASAGDWYSDQEANAVVTFDDSDAILSGLQAGDVLVVRIVLFSRANGENDNYARVGAITINWKSNLL
jgi:hypothetical protein